MGDLVVPVLVVLAIVAVGAPRLWRDPRHSQIVALVVFFASAAMIPVASYRYLPLVVTEGVRHRAMLSWGVWMLIAAINIVRAMKTLRGGTKRG